MPHTLFLDLTDVDDVAFVFIYCHFAPHMADIPFHDFHRSLGREIIMLSPSN